MAKKKETGIEKIEGNTVVINDVDKFSDHLQGITKQLERQNSNTVKIKKAKIVDGIFLDVEYNEDLPGHSMKKNKASLTVPVHDDLKDAFKKLHLHLAYLCDEVKVPKKFNEEDAIDEFGVRGFSVGGNDDNEGVTISGYKDGQFGIVNLNTPFTKWASDDYPFAGDLALAVQAAIYEVEEYLFNGKRAPEQQLSMEFDEETKTEETTEE